MTYGLEAAFAEALKLPEDQQESLAALILHEIDSERSWDELFDRPESHDLLASMADKAIADRRAGRSRRLDLGDL